MIRCCCTLNFIKSAFHFVWGYQAVNFRIPLNKALFFFCANSGYILVFTPHIYSIILISMIVGNLVEIRLPKIQSRKCLWKSNLWRYRAENVFGSLILTRLDSRGYQPQGIFFFPHCLKCSLLFKPILSLIFC